MVQERKLQNIIKHCQVIYYEMEVKSDMVQCSCVNFMKRTSCAVYGNECWMLLYDVKVVYTSYKHPKLMAKWRLQLIHCFAIIDAISRNITVC